MTGLPNLKVVKYFPSEISTVKIMGDGPKNAKGEIISSVLRISPTPFGSAFQKDLHDQYFNETTYFGDDYVAEKFGLYEHFMNSFNNSEMAKSPKKDNILGVARLVKEENDPTRWFDIEIARSHTYHDFVFKLAEMGILGASTQAFMNSVEVEDDGFIPVWIESEVGPTVSPANPESIKQIASLKMQKPFISLPPMAVKMWNEDNELVDYIVGNKKDKKTEEVIVEEQEDSAVEEVPLSEAIDALLGDAVDEAAAATEETVDIDLTDLPTREQYEDLKAELGELKAQLAGIGDISKKLDTLLSGQGESNKSFLALAHFIKNFKISDAGKQFAEMSKKEREILKEVEDEKKPLKRAGTVAPIGAPGTN